MFVGDTHDGSGLHNMLRILIETCAATRSRSMDAAVRGFWGRT
jgi:hypothetical protein